MSAYPAVRLACSTCCGEGSISIPFDCPHETLLDLSACTRCGGTGSVSEMEACETCYGLGEVEVDLTDEDVDEFIIEAIHLQHRGAAAGAR